MTSRGRVVANENDWVDVMNAVIRPIGIGSVCTAVLVGLGGGAAAQAAPPAGDGQASCAYTLSKPFVVEVSGVKMVSATLTTMPCTGYILPNDMTVCVELQGSGMPPQCTRHGGNDPIHVYFAPYRPGATYTSTGTGCGSAAPLYLSVCATRGPYTATL